MSTVFQIHQTKFTMFTYHSPPPLFCIQKINMYVIVIVDCTMWKPWNNKTVDEHIIIPFSSKENTKLLLVHVHFVVKTCLCFNSLREQWHNKRVQKTGLLEKVRWWKIWVFCLQEKTGLKTKSVDASSWGAQNE